VSDFASPSSEYSLYVLITHFVPPDSKPHHLFRDFIKLRINRQYLRSFGRLLKYGSRGATPWKRDVMTKIRKESQIRRRGELTTSIKELLSLKVKSIQIHIHTNSKIEAQKITEDFRDERLIFHVFPQYSKMNVIHNSPWDERDSMSPWRLTWEHRRTLQNLVERSSGKNLFLYIENDILFKQENLDYWLRALPLLEEYGYIPSFLRVEYSETKMSWFPMDNLSGERVRLEESSIYADLHLFTQLPNTYSGCYLLTDELAREFIESDSFDLEKSRERIWWDIGARATVGLQFENVPPGAKSRYLLPVKGSGIAPESWIHHLPNLYIRQLGVEGKLPADDFLLT